MKPLILLIFLLLQTYSLSAQNENRNKRVARLTYNSAVEAILAGNYQEAYSFLKESLAYDPSVIEALSAMAKVKIELGMVNEAIGDFKFLASKEPGNGEYWFYIGYLEFDGIASDSVLGYFNKADSLGFSLSHLYYNRGLIKYLKEDYQGAISDFTKTIELDNDYYLAYHDRGSAKRLMGDMQGALNDFRMATNLYYNFPVAFNNMGSVKIALGDIEGAIQDYSVAIKQDSTFTIAYNNRGAAYFLLGKIDDALIDFENALITEESYIPAVINKASAFSKNMKNTEAIEIFDEILNKSPQNGIAYLNRGLVRELTGDLKGACDDWNKAFSLGVVEAENFIKECK